MQSLFNKHKRKHTDASRSEERNKKHKKHNDNPNESPLPFDVSIRSSSSRRESSDQGNVSQKITNLVRALNDALEEDGMDETLNLIGDENLNRCLDLRSSLKRFAPKIDDTPLKTPPSSQSHIPRKSLSHDFFNPPPTSSAYSITPWKSSTIPLTLPPLPEILDPTLEAACFTHPTFGRGAAANLHYDRLEWVGDAYVYFISTLLISQTFQTHTPGKQSQLRERIVKNVTLSAYSRQYGLDKRLRMPPAVESNIKENEVLYTKILGDLFEAYVAAVVLSDQVNGTARVAEWLKELWGMTLVKDIIDEERHGVKVNTSLWKLRGNTQLLQGVDSPRDGAEDTLPANQNPDSKDEGKATKASTTNLFQAEKIPLNPKEMLQRTIGAKGVRLTYKDAAPERKDKETKLPLFTVGVYLDGWGAKDKQLGYGTANGKKEAGFKAAEMAMANKKLMKIYTDQKAIYDAQMALERAEEEKMKEANLKPEGV